MARIATIIDRFPHRELSIRRLCSQDPDFLEACEDFDEAVAELARAHSVNNEQRAENFRRLLAELETEILKDLDKSAVQISRRE